MYKKKKYLLLIVVVMILVLWIGFLFSININDKDKTLSKKLPKEYEQLIEYKGNRDLARKVVNNLPEVEKEINKLFKKKVGIDGFKIYNIGVSPGEYDLSIHSSKYGEINFTLWGSFEKNKEPRFQIEDPEIDDKWLVGAFLEGNYFHDFPYDKLEQLLKKYNFDYKKNYQLSDSDKDFFKVKNVISLGLGPYDMQFNLSNEEINYVKNVIYKKLPYDEKKLDEIDNKRFKIREDYKGEDTNPPLRIWGLKLNQRIYTKQEFHNFQKELNEILPEKWQKSMWNEIYLTDELFTKETLVEREK